MASLGDVIVLVLLKNIRQYAHQQPDQKRSAQPKREQPCYRGKAAENARVRIKHDVAIAQSCVGDGRKIEAGGKVGKCT